MPAGPLEESQSPQTSNKPEPVLRNIKQSLPMQLLQAREAAMGYFRPLLRSHNLTEQQWRVIRVLADCQCMDATELARHCFLHPPSLTRILQTLAADGLINREPDPSDQRRSMVRLSQSGRQKFAQISPHSENAYQAIEARFGTANLQTLYQLLDELNQTLTEPPPIQETRYEPK